MPRMPKEDVNFEINCTKAKWEPKTIEDIPKVISRAFEVELTLEDILPIVGTDHVKEWKLEEDKDIPVFIAEKSMLNEAFAEKVIRFHLPKGVMPKKWQPKKVKILARGPKVAKYFGEDQMGERQVQVSLKLFECGHFYMKQTLPGSGISPHWTIFEGSWTHTERGLKLEFQIRYSWQLSRKPEFDLNIEAVPAAGWSTTLAWSGGDSETQLNGNIPAIVGSDKWCWAELCRDADSVEKVASRFNEDLEDDDYPLNSKEASRIRPKKEAGSSNSAATPETELKRGEPTGDSSVHQRREGSAAAEPQRSTGSSGSSSSIGAGASAVANSEEESAMPLYVGLAIFLVILAYFAWQKMMEMSASWAAAKEASETW